MTIKADLKDTLDDQVPLGRSSPYPKAYDKNLLYPVLRQRQRDAMGFAKDISFFGADIWNCYELCWRNAKGKPERASITFQVAASSLYLPESKSVKLYINSLNNHQFSDQNELVRVMEQDLTEITNYPIKISLNPPSHRHVINSLSDFYCLDELDISIDEYEKNDLLLRVEQKNLVHERVCTHIFKSHCLMTGQPDWGSIFIDYEGALIERTSLLKYLCSYHEHRGFAENCIEQIYMDLMEHAYCKRLMVYGRFTRRGGIDINPYRCSEPLQLEDSRLIFQ